MVVSSQKFHKYSRALFTVDVSPLGQIVLKTRGQFKKSFQCSNPKEISGTEREKLQAEHPIMEPARIQKKDPMTTNLDFSQLGVQDALDLAVLIEKEAEERYLWFASLLGERYRGDAADFFSMMARNEQRHGKELMERRRLLFGDTPSRITADMIEDVEAPETGKPGSFMSPRHALEVAMESEVKAYEFFDRALPSIEDLAVRELFEELRDEEIEHQRLLKEQRTKYPETLEPDVPPDEVDTPAL